MKQKEKPDRADAYVTLSLFFSPASPTSAAYSLTAIKLSAAVICMHSIPIGNTQVNRTRGNN